MMYITINENKKHCNNLKNQCQLSSMPIIHMSIVRMPIVRMPIVLAPLFQKSVPTSSNLVLNHSYMFIGRAVPVRLL